MSREYTLPKLPLLSTKGTFSASQPRVRRTIVSYMAASPCGLRRMVWPTMLALLVRAPLRRPILYIVYRSLRWLGLKPSISGMAAETMTLMA